MCQLRDRLWQKFDEIKADPFEPQHSKPLKGIAQRSARVGNLRILFRVEGPDLIVAEDWPSGPDLQARALIASSRPPASVIGELYRFLAASQSRVCTPPRPGQAHATCLYAARRSPYRPLPNGSGARANRKKQYYR